MCYVFSHLDRAQKSVGKSKDSIPVPLVQPNKSCLVAASCPFKQKLVCCSIWQSSTRSCRNRFLLLLPRKGQKIRSASHGLDVKNQDCGPARNYTIVFSPMSQAICGHCSAQFRSPNEDWMHLTTKRLTGK